MVRPQGRCSAAAAAADNAAVLVSCSATHEEATPTCSQVHYGRASLAPVNSLPAFFVLPKEALDVPATAAAVSGAAAVAIAARCDTSAAAAAPSEDGAGSNGGGAGGFAAVVVLLDQGYQHLLQDLRRLLMGGDGTDRTGGAGGEKGHDKVRCGAVCGRGKGGGGSGGGKAPTT
jgi:hypothetical protein